jgi:predicted CoA-binding protein
MEDRRENVAVVGASPKENRYSYKAMMLLEEKGHNPIPIAPLRKEILGRTVYPSLIAVPDKIDTITLYVGPLRQHSILDDAIRIKPRRIIFNPGTENPAEYDRLEEEGIEVIVACTLIMLCTDQF